MRFRAGPPLLHSSVRGAGIGRGARRADDAPGATAAVKGTRGDLPSREAIARVG